MGDFKKSAGTLQREGKISRAGLPGGLGGDYSPWPVGGSLEMADLWLPLFTAEQDYGYWRPVGLTGVRAPSSFIS